MGQFRREGTFTDRAAFLDRLRDKVAHLRSAVLPGMTEVWEKEDGFDHVRLSGFGASMRFTVGVQNWTCQTVLPDWLPIPQKRVEEKFDEELSDLMTPS